MKKILIVSHAMELGGAERSLLGLLSSIDYSKYSVDLFLLRHEGELLPLIPQEVNLLPKIDKYAVLARPMKTTLLEGHILLTTARAFGKLAAKLYEKLHRQSDSIVALEYSHKYTCPFMPEINPETEYDLAISYLTPHYFTAKKVKAKSRLAWIHTDYSKVAINVRSELKMWDKMDYIASISEGVTESFLNTFTTLKEKIVLIENILPKRLIDAQAKEAIKDFDSNCVNLLSIGRFTTQKNFDNIPEICSCIVKDMPNVRWYLLGYGADEPLIRQKIAEFNMQKHVIILGKKDNPYPFIRACDLYVQPSRYEGKCVAVREAQLLCKPVVITDYATSASQLEDGVDGVIVPIENKSCANGIIKLLKDRDRMKKLSNSCSKRDYTNSAEINKLYSLIN